MSVKKRIEKAPKKRGGWSVRLSSAYQVIVKCIWIRIALLLLLLIFIPYTLAPKTATIYYANDVPEICFTLSVPERLTFDVRSDSAKNGRVLFEPGSANGADAEISLENTLAEENKYLFSGQTEVTSSGSFLHIKLETADRSPFFCTVKIEEEKEQDGALNRIHIYDLPENVEIIFNNGDDTPFSVAADDAFGSIIPDGEYRAKGCGSLRLYMSRPAGEAAEADHGLPSYMFGVEGHINKFDLLNSSRTTLEATVNGTTDFHELGHIRIAGESPRRMEGDPLWIKIPDTGTYPIEVELSGVTEGLIIGDSYYNLKTLAQWVYENWSEVLLSVLGALFAGIISKIFSNKEERNLERP